MLYMGSIALSHRFILLQLRLYDCYLISDCTVFAGGYSYGLQFFSCSPISRRTVTFEICWPDDLLILVGPCAVCMQYGSRPCHCMLWPVGGNELMWLWSEHRKGGPLWVTMWCTRCTKKGHFLCWVSGPPEFVPTLDGVCRYECDIGLPSNLWVAKISTFIVYGRLHDSGLE
jgi:hypothetical protein